MRFSQRIGKAPVRTIIQLEGMDDDLRISLWNELKSHYFDLIRPEPTINGGCYISRSTEPKIFHLLWKNFFKIPLDGLQDDFEDAYEFVRVQFFKYEWFRVYDMLEFIIQNAEMTRFFSLGLNRVLEAELSGYRLIEKNIVPISDEREIGEIQEAVKNGTSERLSAVRMHLNTAIEKISNRKDPDFRNSIKESICALESLCKVIAGLPHATLPDALNVLSKKVTIHKALKAGINSIYGYTSDSGGIRHGMSEGSMVDYHDAKFMLVSCSALINFLLAKTGEELSHHANKSQGERCR